MLKDQKKMLRKAGCISRYVFPNKNMDFITQQNFRRAWQRYCNYNGIEYAQTPYELRDTYISVNVEMPGGLKKMVVGHSVNMDTEGTYSHQEKCDMEKAADYIDNAFDEILNL